MIDAILFSILIIATFAILLTYLINRGGYLKVPFLVGAVFAGWVIPQIWSLMARNAAPGSSMTALLLMSILCLLATLFGWRTGISSKADLNRRILPPVSETNVGKAATLLTAIALIGFLGVGFKPGAEQESNLWTGQATIFYFILNIKVVSFTASLILFLRRRSGFTIALLAINLLMYFPYVVILFKRRQIAELAILSAFALLLIRNWAIPRAAVAAAFVMAALGTFAAAELRQITIDGEVPTLAEISEINFLALSPINDPEASPEITNGAQLIHAVQLTDKYTFGGQIWNRIVFQYVPGQFVGFDVKSSLMATAWPERLMYDTTRYNTPTGTTQTGMGTAFMEFGYFGSIIFLLVGYFMARLWHRAVAGNTWDKLWYAAGIAPSFIMITSHSAYFIVTFFLYLVVMTFVAVAVAFLFQQNRATRRASWRGEQADPRKGAVRRG